MTGAAAGILPPEAEITHPTGIFELPLLLSVDRRQTGNSTERNTLMAITYKGDICLGFSADDSGQTLKRLMVFFCDIG